MSRVLPMLLLLLVAATGVGLLLQFLSPPPATGGGGTPAAPTLRAGIPQGHLYTGITEQPNDFNPFTTTSAVALTYVIGFTHDALMSTDPATGALRPALASAWEVAPDGRSMVVTLREGVAFADGAPMTIADVLFTWEVARTEDVVLGAIADGLNLVAGVTVLDGAPQRLRIDFKGDHFAAARVVGENWFVVQRQWFEDRIAEQAQRAEVPVPKAGQPGFGALLAKVVDAPGPGTGPYLFADESAPRPSWRRGRDLTLFRNEHNWQRKAEPGCWNLGGIRLLFIGDPAARHATLMQRGVDWYSAQDARALLASDAGLAADYRNEVYDRDSLGLFVCAWNVRRPHLGDARVRRALGLLFDREKIVRSILGGVGRPAAAFGKPDRPGYPRDLEPLACDPPQARRLLREAGISPEDGVPLRLELLVPAEVSFYRQVAEFAVDAARSAGVEIHVQELPGRELMDRLAGDDWDGAVVQMSLNTAGDPYEVFHSNGAKNRMHWSDARADALLERQRTEHDATRRAALLDEFHHLVAAEQPMALLVHPLAQILVGVHLQNATPGPRGLWPERFWMPVEFQRPGP